MAVYLFTTTDIKGSRSYDLMRYLNSLNDQHALPGSIVSYILLQNCSPQACEIFRKQAPALCRISSAPQLLSLSSARNQLLREFQADNLLGDDDVIGFPDDDCWLPQGLTSGLLGTFRDLPTLGFLICGLSLQPETCNFGPSDVRVARTSEIVRLTSSNCMYIRGSVLKKIGEFDPALGLGTPALSGEDTEFGIRASLESELSGMIDRELVGHRKPDEASVVKYYHGTLIVLARYATKSPSLMKEFCRKVLVGFYFVLRRRIQLLLYIRLVLQAMYVVVNSVCIDRLSKCS